ncbi:MAG: phage portal protein [Betaproteobacteria bacterium]|nr:phage portal protein [Betaproteobacteria bacterium]
MKILGFEITRRKAQTLSAVISRGGWFGILRESFSGAWQSNVAVDAPREILAFSGVFACCTAIAGDIGKLRPKLVEEDEQGICNEIKKGSPFLPVLRKPNKFQTRIKFFEQWIVSKLLYGNTYVLKRRDGRGLVNGLYILDAQRVTPLVAENGDVYYQLAVDHLSGLTGPLTVPASEIIHDTMVCLWHPLVGVSAIYACALSATMGNRIQANSTKFFDNMSRPSGMLSAPGEIHDDVAARLKAHWEENFSGKNIGRVAVLGDGLKYEAMTIPAQEAQLIEQLRWTVEDVARCFHMPLFKIGGPMPAGVTGTAAVQQMYYTDCLQSLIESLELSLDEGLSLPANYYTELDLDGLLRMDTMARLDTLGKAVGAGIMAPDEARAKENLPAVPGGKYPYLQQQNFSLEALAKRDALADPFAAAKPPAPVPAPAPAPEAANDGLAAAAAMADIFIKGLEEYEPA